MAYELVEIETYKGYPTAREVQNHCLLSTYSTIDDVMNRIIESSRGLKSNLELINEWVQQEHNTVVKRELYQSKNGHGRILRKYEIKKSRVQIREYDDSLI